MRVITLAAIFALAACGQPPAETAQPAAAPPSGVETPPAPSAAIDGWEIDMTAYSRVGTVLPPLSGKRADGSDFSSDTLRGRWTILGVWPATGEPPDETSFTAALNSAVDQDPDLDLLVIHQPPTDGSPQGAPPWPAVMDNGTIAAALASPSTPAYLLVGPDLTIEGYRGALVETPDDGIKSVIRGVAEIRRQVAAPQ